VRVAWVWGCTSIFWLLVPWVILGSSALFFIHFFLLHFYILSLLVALIPYSLQEEILMFVTA
jgi:hypothetical protein